MPCELLILCTLMQVTWTGRWRPARRKNDTPPWLLRARGGVAFCCAVVDAIKSGALDEPSRIPHVEEQHAAVYGSRDTAGETSSVLRSKTAQLQRGSARNSAVSAVILGNAS